MARISFAMAARNSAQWVQRALDSIPMALEGNSVAYEVLLADGGSRDRTIELALGRPHVRLVSTQDAGIYDGMNKAIEAATGDFLLILNSDDTLVAKGLQNAIASLHAHKGAPMASGAALSGDTLETATLVHHDAPLSVEGAFFGIPLINARLFRREAFQALGPFLPDIGLGADREFLIRAARAGYRGVAVDTPLYFYRSHPGSQTMSADIAGRNRVYEADMAVAQHYQAPDDKDVRRLAKALGALAAIKLMGRGTVGGPLPLPSLINAVRGLSAWHRWRGRSVGA